MGRPGIIHIIRYNMAMVGPDGFLDRLLIISLGAVAPMLIHGPASADYDDDLGVLMISDFCTVHPAR